MDSVFPLDFSLPHKDSQELILLKFLMESKDSIRLYGKKK